MKSSKEDIFLRLSKLTVSIINMDTITTEREAETEKQRDRDIHTYTHRHTHNFVCLCIHVVVVPLRMFMGFLIVFLGPFPSQWVTLSRLDMRVYA